jgi:uncharacterized membrane protein
MKELVIAGAVFLTTHLGISSGLRGAILRPIGERGYLAMYSLLAVAALGYLIHTYVSLPHDQYLWLPSPAAHWVPLLAMPIALFLLVGGFMTRNPTAVGQESAIAGACDVRGAVRITRHPFQWAVGIWAVSHIVANGDLASLVFFGTLGAVALGGTLLIDEKKKARLGADWDRFAAVTSNVPFAAILSGRNCLATRELWLPAAVGLGAYVLLLWGHRWVSGVPLVFN